MNSSKLWHSFALICTYLLFTALIANIGSLCFQNVEAHWGFPIGIGAAFWIVSLILWCQHEKHNLFIVFALLTNGIGAGFSIAAYIVGTSIQITFPFLLALAAMIAALYLILMLLLTIPHLKDLGWYVAICYIVWMTGSVLLGVFVFPHIFEALHLPLTAEFGMFLLFFFLLLGFLALGTLLSADGLFDLLQVSILPSLIATFLLLVIILGVLTQGECGDCCECGEACNCGGGESGKKSSPTKYGGKRGFSQTMSSISNS